MFISLSDSKSLYLPLLHLDLSSLSPTAYAWKSRKENLVPIYPQRINTNKTLDLEIEKSMGTFRGQLGCDIPVTPVSLAALHSLTRWWWCLTGHLPLLVDLEAAFLVDMETIIYTQGGKALLAFTVVLIPTRQAFTHTHVKLGVCLGLLICVGKRRRRGKRKITGWILPSLRKIVSLRPLY